VPARSRATAAKAPAKNPTPCSAPRKAPARGGTARKPNARR
jgi:hypothetical protein